MPARTVPVRDGGFSLVESLIAMVLMLVVTGAVFGLVNPGTEFSQSQPEAMDMQQRARVASDILSRDLFMAGAGIYSGPQTGALTNFFPPIIPRRMGMQGADPYTAVRADGLTIQYVPNTYSQTTIRAPMPITSEEIKVEDMPNCPKGEALCGFKEGMTVLIFDEESHFDFFTITNVQNDAGHLQHYQQDVSYAYDAGAFVTEAATHTYYLDAATRTLRHYDGYLTDVPVVDNVVGLTFTYYGDPNPPLSPKPPVGKSNCLYDAAGNLVGGLQTLASQGGSLAELPLSLFADGPWCGNGNNRFDVDLMRIRTVRVTVGVEASPDALRASGADFANSGFSGSAVRMLPDFSLRFDVTPRNMNLGR
jgi:hypothetical protein